MAEILNGGVKPCPSLLVLYTRQMLIIKKGVVKWLESIAAPFVKADHTGLMILFKAGSCVIHFQRIKKEFLEHFINWPVTDGFDQRTGKLTREAINPSFSRLTSENCVRHCADMLPICVMTFLPQRLHTILHRSEHGVVGFL